LGDVFPLITFSDFETFNALPELKRCIIITDAKFSGVNLLADFEFASFHLDQTDSYPTNLYRSVS
jgi:hypothetical protein